MPQLPVKWQLVALKRDAIMKVLHVVRLHANLHVRFSGVPFGHVMWGKLALFIGLYTCLDKTDISHSCICCLQNV